MILSILQNIHFQIGIVLIHAIKSCPEQKNYLFIQGNRRSLISNPLADLLMGSFGGYCDWFH